MKNSKNQLFCNFLALIFYFYKFADIFRFYDLLLNLYKNKQYKTALQTLELMFISCKKNIDKEPICDSKNMPILKEQIIAKWNAVGFIDGYNGFKVPLEFKADGTIVTPIEFIERHYSDLGILHDYYTWKGSTTELNSVFLKPYDKDGFGYVYEYETLSKSCDRINLSFRDNRLILYNNSYKIPAICGVDTSKGNADNWLIGKWNYSIKKNRYYENLNVRNQKGTVEFKNDFTIIDSNSFGLIDILPLFDYKSAVAPRKFIWFGEQFGGFYKFKFYIFAGQNADVVYKDLDNCACTIIEVACDKIVFNTCQDHEVTLTRIK